MKKTYAAPVAELLIFAKEDVITASPVGNLGWELPTIDISGSYGNHEWSEDEAVLKI